jgi:hypothetical protein
VKGDDLLTGAVVNILGDGVPAETKIIGGGAIVVDPASHFRKD